LCEELKQLYPKKPVVGVGADPGEAHVDAFVEFGKVDQLCDKVAELVGEPKIIPRDEIAS
jgi:hypothetical protein